MIPLNQRLKEVSNFVNHKTLADIGSDHAYLPLYLLEQNKIECAIAGEVVKGPFEAAKQNVAKYQKQDLVDVRLGNGLDVIKAGEVDVITICGMGGPLIKEILLNGKDKLIHFPTLILQSNIHTEAVREAILTLGYQIEHEVIMKEKKHIYEILVCNQSVKKLNYTPLEMKFGPYLLKEKNDVFREKWQRELNQLQNVAEGIKNQKEHQEKYASLIDQISVLKEVLK